MTGLTIGSLRSCQSTILSTLGQDTTAISAAHSLHIYLARLGLATQCWQVCIAGNDDPNDWPIIHQGGKPEAHFRHKFIPHFLPRILHISPPTGAVPLFIGQNVHL